MQNKKFFDKVSSFFDNMTNSPKVINVRKLMLKNYITEEMKTAVDLGCGTGNDSIALSLNGLAVDGFDLSNDMIKAANENASKYGVKINFYNKSIDFRTFMTFGEFVILSKNDETLSKNFLFCIIF